MRRFLSLLALASTSTLLWLPSASTSSAVSPTLEDELLRHATLVLQRAVDTSPAAIPASVMVRARAIAVVPGAFKEGMRYTGLGVLSAQGANPAYWTPPAVLSFEGAIPLDLEADVLDFVLVAQTARGLEHLSRPRFVSPVIHPIFPGPVGQNTGAQLGADLLAYIQFGDYFVGVTVEDWMVTEMTTSNARLYGRPYTTDEIVHGDGFFHLPAAARLWRNALMGYFSRMS